MAVIGLGVLLVVGAIVVIGTVIKRLNKLSAEIAVLLPAWQTDRLWRTISRRAYQTFEPASGQLLAARWMAYQWR